MSAYEGRLIRVAVEDGKEIVHHPGSVAIVAVDEDGAVTLVRQWRAPAGKELLELPAGTLEPGEEPLETAKRELEEEVGLVGGEWRELAAFWTTPGFCTEKMHVFAALGCRRGAAAPEDDEEIAVVSWTRHEVERRLGELEDAKTLAALLLYLRELG